MTPTPEQREILAHANSSSSLMIFAYAGTGKTTTLEMLAKEITIPGLALAFNVRIKEELSKRFPANFTVQTLNGLGHSAWGKTLGRKLVLREAKLSEILSQICKDDGLTLDEDFAFVKDLVERAMRAGIVPQRYASQYRGLGPDNEEHWDLLNEEGLSQELVEIARKVLTESVTLALQGTISFSDQLYMPTIFGGVFPKFPVVMVDEAQDLSYLQHKMVQRCSAGGRLIVVGDPFQAIYGWRGAETDSMAKMKDLKPSWIDLPLTTTFRCPHSIVERQQHHAKGFTAAPSNSRGNVLTLERGWTLPEGDLAVICRNNAPLFSFGMKLLRKRISIAMIGRDIGKSLIRLAEKILPDKGNLVRAIELWAIDEMTKHPKRSESIQDRAESLQAIAEDCQSKEEVIQVLNDLFGNTFARVTLTSGHRSKGLEWNTVLHLDPWRVPSKFARQQAKDGNPEPLRQEENLRYVIETRTKRTLYLANLEDFEQKDLTQHAPALTP